MTQLKVCAFSHFFLLLLSLPVGATVVTLLNGDQLSGEIKSESATHLILHHAILGDITIPKKQLLTGPVTDKPVPAKTVETKTDQTKAAADEKPEAAIEKLAKQKQSADKLPGLFGLELFKGLGFEFGFEHEYESHKDKSLAIQVANNFGLETRVITVEEELKKSPRTPAERVTFSMQNFAL